MKAVVTIGISGSGKSTWAKKQSGFNIIERDIIRKKMMERSSEDQNFWNIWNWKLESDVTEHVNDFIDFSADRGRDIIISDTNLNEKFRKPLIEKLEKLGYDVELKVFDVTYEAALKNDNKRRDSVGQQIIAKQYQSFVDEFREKPIRQPQLPSAVLVDIDGTAAHMNGKRGPFEWDKVYMDDVDYSVREMVLALSKGNEIIFLSGRDGICREMTEKWLDDNHFPCDGLFMREAGDSRSDTIVKKEIFDNFIHNNFDVMAVIDDRPKVCRMWRELGLKVFQVGNPHIEF